MRRLLTWLGWTLAASAAAFSLGFWLATGSVRMLPEAVPPEPAPEAPASAPADASAGEEEGGYRIRIMEETELAARGAAEEAPVEPTREERGGAVILRQPAGKAALAVVVDASASAAAAGEEVAAGQMAALEAFAAGGHPGLVLAARTMGGDAGGECDDSRVVMAPLEGEGMVPAGWDAGGPRNVSRAMYLAAGDLAGRRGKKGVVVVSTGVEECREWPCETARALLATTDRIRTWTVFFSPSPEPEPEEGAILPAPEGEASPESGGTEEGDDLTLLPESGGTGPPSRAATPRGPVEEVTVPESLRCMAEAGGGAALVARDRRELAGALERVAEDLSGNLTVRLFRGPGEELGGESDPKVSPWSVEVTSLGGTLPTPVTETFLPAGFGLPPGRYRVDASWGEATSTLDDLQVTAGEEVELQLSLHAGRLMVFEGDRPWPPGLAGCRPLVRVEPAIPPAPPVAGLPEGGASAGTEGVATPPPASPAEPPVEKCGLPATFVLPPGAWVVTVSGGSALPRSLEAVVEAGRTLILRSSPGDPLETVGVDKGPAGH